MNTLIKLLALGETADALLVPGAAHLSIDATRRCASAHAYTDPGTAIPHFSGKGLDAHVYAARTTRLSKPSAGRHCAPTAAIGCAGAARQYRADYYASG